MKKPRPATRAFVGTCPCMFPLDISLSTFPTSTESSCTRRNPAHPNFSTCFHSCPSFLAEHALHFWHGHTRPLGRIQLGNSAPARARPRRLQSPRARHFH